MKTRMIQLLLASALVVACPVWSQVAKPAKSFAVLSPEQFVGPVQMGYSAAKSVPEICSKLFCYCGCDTMEQHTSLLNCFEGLHGVDCHICIEEAMQALRMHKEGKSLGQIQKSVDDMFAANYPFEQQSPALKKYLATRQYKSDSPRVTAGSGSAKRGKKPVGKCCGKPQNVR